MQWVTAEYGFTAKKLSFHLNMLTIRLEDNDEKHLRQLKHYADQRCLPLKRSILQLQFV